MCACWYCGAYWHNGFHEDGVVSALDAVKHFEKSVADEALMVDLGGNLRSLFH